LIEGYSLLLFSLIILYHMTRGRQSEQILLIMGDI
jgi:hypothetical protein